MNTLLLEGLVECLSYFKGYEIFKYPMCHLGFPVFLMMLALNLHLSFYNNNKSVRVMDLNFCLLPISKYSKWSLNAKWMENSWIFFHSIWLWLALCLSLTFSSLLVPCADILWVLDKMLKPCIHIFPLVFLIFCIFFPWVWISLGFLAAFSEDLQIIVQFSTFRLFLKFFFGHLPLISFPSSWFLRSLFCFFFLNVGLNLSFKEIWGICTNGKEPHVWITLWLGNDKLYSWWSCGSAD